MPEPVQPLQFRLRYTAAAYNVIDKGGTNPLSRYDLVRDEQYDVYIPATPAGFREFVGTHADIARRADVLNHAQYARGRMLYFYFPDPVKASDGWNPDHCGVCEKQHAQRQKDGA